MRAAPVLQAAWAGAARRLVQSLVVLAVLAVSCAAALTGLTLYAAANAGYAAGVTATHGADLAVTINAAKVTASQLAATRHLPGVTQDAGPYPEATITVAAGAPATGSSGVPATHLTVVGRASPSGPLDDVIANPSVMDLHHSRWPTEPGEISLAVRSGIRVPLGARLTVTSAPGRPVLTVTGYGDELVSPEDAWVVPGEIAALRAAGVPAQEQMLYKFNAGAPAQVRAGLAELKAALPRGAVARSLPLQAGPPPGSGPVPVGETGGGGEREHPVRDRIRDPGPGPGRADYGQRGVGGGDRVLPADRGAQEHRVHPRPGHRHLPGPDQHPRGSRGSRRDHPRELVGAAGHRRCTKCRGRTCPSRCGST